MRSPASSTPIAVVGVGAHFAGSTNKEGFWHDIVIGRDLIADVPPTHWLIEDYYDPDPAAPDKVYSKRGSFLSPVDFDPVKWGIPPANIPATDSEQLLGLLVAGQVLEDACGAGLATLDRKRVSVILGVAATTELTMDMGARLQRPVWARALRESGLQEDEVEEICDRIAASYVPWKESSFPGLLANVVAGRIANHFDLGGTNCVTDAACASSLAALHMAMLELRAGACDLAITGGVDTLNHILMYACFSKTPAFSPTGDCRPFSGAADGTIIGEGLCMMALKRLEDAEHDGNQIYAVIHGIGSSSDGHATSIYAPRASGQVEALRRAYDTAGYGPDTVELVEAHGTGTRAGDAVEFESLRTVFSESGREDMQWCALGSVKSQIGHTKATAGAAGLFKAVMALHHGVLPPTIKVDQPNPNLNLPRSPFYLNTQSRPWIRDASHPRRASVSSFGFGGTNFHVAVEEYAGPGRRAPRIRTSPSELIVMGAENAHELSKQCRDMARELDATPGDPLLAFQAYRSQRDFDPAAALHLALVADSDEDLRRKLLQAAEAAERRPVQTSAVSPGVYWGEEPCSGDIAFLFPGQGSQYVGMGADLAMAFDVVREVWDACGPVPLSDGTPLHQVVFPTPVFSSGEGEAQGRRLTRTECAQPAIGVASLAQLALLRALGIAPASVGGHSFGEITALHAAGVLQRDDFLRIALRRGALMAEAATSSGGMTAVFHPSDEVRAVAEGLDVVLANRNAPRQSVFAGPIAALDALEDRLTAAEITFQRLQVATAFHSPLVSQSLQPFARYLEEIEFIPPSIPVYSNSQSKPYPADTQAARLLVTEQIARPVLFMDQVEAMYAGGARIFVEVGPSAVLTGLVGQVLAGKPHAAISLDRKGTHGLTALWTGLAQLAVAGVPIDFEPLWQEYPPPPDPRTQKKPALTFPIGGANYAKPYPPEEGHRQPGVPQSQQPPPLSRQSEVRSDPLPPVHAQPARERRPSSALNGTEPSSPKLIQPGASTVSDDQQRAALFKAFEEMQRQLSESQSAYQQTLAQSQIAYQRTVSESHLAYLRATETSMTSLAALLSGSTVPIAVATPTVEPQSTYRLDTPINGVSQPALDDPTEVYPHQPQSFEMPRLSTVGADGIQAAIDPSENMDIAMPSTSVAPVDTAVPAEDVNLGSMLLSIVADKTGYPIEVLNLDVELEAGLGIDSIKRVEILSALRERAPDLPQVEPGQLATLQTLRAIVEFMEGSQTVQVEPQSEITASVHGAESTDPSPPLKRFTIRLSEAPPQAFAMPGLLDAPGPIFISDDGRGIAAELASCLQMHGVDAVSGGEVPADAGGLIVLAGLRPVADVMSAVEINREAFELVTGLAPRFGAVAGGVLITVQDMGGDFGLAGTSETRAWLGGLGGLARTAATEWSGLAIKCIDLESAGRSPEELAEAITRELIQGGPEEEVGLQADGPRVTPVYAEEPLEVGTLAVNDRSVLAVSGGARGVTAAALLELARYARPRIALFGRSELRDEPAECRGIEEEKDLKRVVSRRAQTNGRNVSPAEISRQVRDILASREVRATLAGLTSAGCQVRYFALDIRDGAAVREALASVRQEWGSITGLIHGAGVLADKLIGNKTIDQFHEVFGTKVAGLRTLLEATENDPLTCICLFSSVAARIGNPGQSDYAMANDVLNKVAHLEARRRGDGCLVKSIGWGPWDAGMMTESLQAYFRQRGVALIPGAAGAVQFVAELQDRRRDGVEVLITADTLERTLPEGEHKPWRGDILVNRTTYPYLDSHRVQGTPVVPLALVLEWFVRAARTLHPDWQTLSVEELRVLRGIRLPAFAGEGAKLTVQVAASPPGGPSSLCLELRGAADALHYSARVHPAAGTGAGWRDETEDLDLEAWQWPASEIYDGKLFHGPDFQAIRSLDGVSNKAATAVLAGIREIGWNGLSWHSDVVALDGGLQLARLWTLHVLGYPTLPTGIGSVTLFRHHLSPDPIRCVLHARSVLDHRTVCDIHLHSLRGDVIARLEGVEMHVIPSETAASSA